MRKVRNVLFGLLSLAAFAAVLYLFRDATKTLLMVAASFVAVFVVARMWEWHERGMSQIRVFFFATALSLAWRGYVSLGYVLGQPPDPELRLWVFAIMDSLEALAVLWFGAYMLRITGGR